MKSSPEFRHEAILCGLEFPETQALVAACLHYTSYREQRGNTSTNLDRNIIERFPKAEIPEYKFRLFLVHVGHVKRVLTDYVQEPTGTGLLYPGQGLSPAADDDMRVEEAALRATAEGLTEQIDEAVSNYHLSFNGILSKLFTDYTDEPPVQDKTVWF
jgi:hypothetical protein